MPAKGHLDFNSILSKKKKKNLISGCKYLKVVIAFIHALNTVEETRVSRGNH